MGKKIHREVWDSDPPHHSSFVLHWVRIQDFITRVTIDFFVDITIVSDLISHGIVNILFTWFRLSTLIWVQALSAVAGKHFIYIKNSPIESTLESCWCRTVDADLSVHMHFCYWYGGFVLHYSLYHTLYYLNQRTMHDKFAQRNLNQVRHSVLSKQQIF